MNTPELPDGYRWGVSKVGQREQVQVTLYYNGNEVAHSYVNLEWADDKNIVSRVESGMRNLWLDWERHLFVINTIEANWP